MLIVENWKNTQKYEEKNYPQSHLMEITSLHFFLPEFYVHPSALLKNKIGDYGTYIESYCSLTIKK